MYTRVNKKKRNSWCYERNIETYKSTPLEMLDWGYQEWEKRQYTFIPARRVTMYKQEEPVSVVLRII